VGKGSGRSISAFDLHAALGTCAHLLDRFGGHKMAAGVTVHRDRLEAFRECFTEAARERLAPEDLGPEQRVDLVLELREATRDLERMCRHLEPTGTSNPGPVFGVRGARLTGWSRVGNGHLKGTLEQGGVRLAAIGFQWFDRVPWLTGAAPGAAPLVDAAFRLECNEWNGTTTLQARLVAITEAEGRKGGKAE
jgi:single-stranded-DNA-specific exonuclease